MQSAFLRVTGTIRVNQQQTGDKIVARQYPIIGAWYQDAVEDVLFEVVAVDDHSATIEIQFIGGEVSEIDYESWKQMVLLPAEAPEDWQASYEISSEDSQQVDDVFIPDNYEDPLSSIEPDSSVGQEDY